MQRTEIRLGRGSTLLWWEAFAPGRLAAGERFAFERLHVQTEVYAGPRPVLREDYLLEPRRKDLSATARMFDYSHAASLCGIQEARPPAFLRMLEGRLNEIARERTRIGQAVWGASMLASDGVVVRGVSASGCSLQRERVIEIGAGRIGPGVAGLQSGANRNRTQVASRPRGGANRRNPSSNSKRGNVAR